MSGEREIAPAMGANEHILGGNFLLQKKKGGGRWERKTFQAEVQKGTEKLQRRGMGSQSELIRRAACVCEAEGIMESFL